MYDVPGGAERGGHSLKTCHQFLIAIAGSFDVILKDGEAEKRIRLDRSYRGLYIHPEIWREMDNFSTGAICLVLASGRYDEFDYIRDYKEFLTWKEKY